MIARALALLAALGLAAAPAIAAPGTDDPWAGRTDLLQPPPFKPSTRVDLGKVVRYRLPNGLQVIVVPRPTSE